MTDRQIVTIGITCLFMTVCAVWTGNIVFMSTVWFVNGAAAFYVGFKEV